MKTTTRAREAGAGAGYRAFQVTAGGPSDRTVNEYLAECARIWTAGNHHDEYCAYLLAALASWNAAVSEAIAAGLVLPPAQELAQSLETWEVRGVAEIRRVAAEQRND